MACQCTSIWLHIHTAGAQIPTKICTVHNTMYNINLAPYMLTNSHPPPPKRESHQKLGTSQPSAKEWINLHKQQLFESLIQISGQHNVNTDINLKWGSFAKRNPSSNICWKTPAASILSIRRHIRLEETDFIRVLQSAIVHPKLPNTSILSSCPLSAHSLPISLETDFIRDL